MSQSNSSENRIGLAFPLKFGDGKSQTPSGDKSRRLMACTYEEHIKQSIRALLLTGRRERVMRRDFGSRAGAYLFENIGPTTALLIQHEITETIERYEPRVELTGVMVRGNPQSPGVLHAEIGYRILSTDKADQLTVDIGR